MTDDFRRAFDAALELGLANDDRAVFATTKVLRMMAEELDRLRERVTYLEERLRHV